jgi:hypothetical protein
MAFTTMLKPFFEKRVMSGPLLFLPPEAFKKNEVKARASSTDVDYLIVMV